MVDYKKKYLKYKNKYLQAKKNIKIKGGIVPSKIENFIKTLVDRGINKLTKEQKKSQEVAWSGLKKSSSELGTGKSPIVVQPENISISSYNISWATQENVAPPYASEADFVTECQGRYKKNGGKKCFENAIKSIKEAIPIHNIKLIGFQEVAPCADSLEKLKEKISNEFNWKFEPFRYTDKRHEISGGVTTVLVSMWDPTIFGEVIEKKIFNLTEDDKDNRPCTIIITDNTIIINAHFPWVTPDNLIECQKKISTKLNEMLGNTQPEKIATLKKIRHIIFVGDTNDAGGLINSVTPLVLNGDNFEFKLHNGLTQEDTKEKLRTCCWHAPGHSWYKEFREPGDYAIIMKIKKNKTNNKFETVFLNPTHHIIETERPPHPKAKDAELRSDHDPIITTV